MRFKFRSLPLYSYVGIGGGQGGRPKTDEVDFLLKKKLLLCSEETDMGVEFARNLSPGQ